MFFLIENTWLIQCKYLFNLKKRVKNKTHIEVLICEAYIIEALICEAYIVEEISTFISYYFELIWERESIAFHDMMMAVKCLPVGTCQYSLILDDPHLKMP